MSDYEKVLEHLRTRCEEIRSEWNGDDDGIKEYRASTAEELLELLKEVDEAVKELDL